MDLQFTTTNDFLKTENHTVSTNERHVMSVELWGPGNPKIPKKRGLGQEDKISLLQIWPNDNQNQSKIKAMRLGSIGRAHAWACMRPGIGTPSMVNQRTKEAISSDVDLDF